jgi:hypothetical protein
VTMVAISSNARFPSCLPSSASVFLSPSVSHTRFSVTRYSFRRSSASSTDPVIYASSVFHSMWLSTSAVRRLTAGEYEASPGGNQAVARVIAGL